MLNEFHCTDASYREVIQDEAAEGRVPIARLLWGEVSGRGWGFLRPWEALAVFPLKGTPGGIRHPERAHCRFWIRRLQPFTASLRHQNHMFPIFGIYWKGVAWREGWKQPRQCILDGEVIGHDPNANDIYDWD